MIDWLLAILARHTRFVLGLVLAGALTAGVASVYGAGRARGREDAAVSAYTARRDTIVDSITVVVERLRIDTVRIAAAVPRADSARQVARVAIEAALRADTTTEPQRAAPEPARPALIGAPRPSALLACSDALTADAVAISALRTGLADCGAHGRLETQRADLAEQRIADMLRHEPRIGWRTGAAIGAGAATALIVVLHHILN